MSAMEPGPRGWALPLYERVLVHVPTGSELLDVGCGSGEFAQVAVDRGLVVSGVDLDRRAVAAASDRVPEGRFRVGDAHDLDWPDAAVDAVVAVQLLAHVTNPLMVLREAARVVRPGGAVVVTVWGREPECEMRLFGEVLAPLLPPRPARRSPDGAPPLTEPDRLTKLTGLAGLRVAAVDEVCCAFRYTSADELVGALLASEIGRVAARRVGPGAVRRAALAGLAGHREPDGGYRLDNLFRVLAARVPQETTMA